MLALRRASESPRGTPPHCCMPHTTSAPCMNPFAPRPHALPLSLTLTSTLTLTSASDASARRVRVRRVTYPWYPKDRCRTGCGPPRPTLSRPPQSEMPTTSQADVHIYLGHGLHPRHRARARHDAAPMLRSNADTMLRRTTAANAARNRPARGDVEVNACDRAATRGPQPCNSDNSNNNNLITTIDDPARHEAKPPRGR